MAKIEQKVKTNPKAVTNLLESMRKLFTTFAAEKNFGAKTTHLTQRYLNQNKWK